MAIDWSEFDNDEALIQFTAPGYRSWISMGKKNAPYYAQSPQEARDLTSHGLIAAGCDPERAHMAADECFRRWPNG